MPLFTFPLNLDGEQEMHPGFLANRQGTVVYLQPLLLELDPTETAQFHSMHAALPFHLEQGVASCSPAKGGCGANKMLCYLLVGLPCAEKVWS